jgi:carbon-monoxide dehydrogenase medium subunit
VITRELEFLRPTTVAEAIEILSQRGTDVTVLSGGMSLLPMMNLGLVRPGIVMTLNHVEGLDGIVVDDDTLSIGAMVRHRQLPIDDAVCRHAPMLAEAARTVGDVQVRNRGTIGGSICHADPAADYLPVLAVSESELVLTSAARSRTVPATEFFVDVMLTVREPDELLTAVVVPHQASRAGSAYVRFARVEGSFAVVNAAARIEPDFVRTAIALGGVGPTPVVIDASDLFPGRIDDQGFRALAERAYAAAQLATADIHSDAEYRRHLAGVLACRAVKKAVTRL